MGTRVPFAERHVPAEWTCRFGSSESHAAFALLHLAGLACFFHASRRAPALLRLLLCLGTAFTLVYHVLLGVMCLSAYISAAVHVYFSAAATARFPVLNFTIAVQSSSWIATYFVAGRCAGAIRAVKLTVVLGLALTNAIATCWWAVHKHFNDTFRVTQLSFAMLAVCSLVYIFSATQSSWVKMCIWLLPPHMLAFGFLGTVRYRTE